eukprot:GABV01008580.1.p1 GENE.GABV01008580.1~~GABV01008580.1.p1  ORF type:complete len:237 (+),score=93.57 GABV01008580.1:673-1383(+)
MFSFDSSATDDIFGQTPLALLDEIIPLSAPLPVQSSSWPSCSSSTSSDLSDGADTLPSPGGSSFASSPSNNTTPAVLPVPLSAPSQPKTELPQPAAPKKEKRATGKKRKAPMLEKTSPENSDVDDDITAVGDGEDEHNAKRRRLTRKAELARISRRRKKERMVELQADNEKLRRELSAARSQRVADLERIAELEGSERTRRVSQFDHMIRVLQPLADLLVLRQQQLKQQQQQQQQV